MKYNLVKKLGVGSAGDAYLLDNGKAIIVGKREDSFGTYKAMYDKMKVLDGKITTINYPKVYELISPCEDYQYGAIVEECIVGKELRDAVKDMDILEKREVGKTLAKFVAEIHGLDIVGDKIEEMNINLAKYDRSISILKDYLPSDVIERLETLRQDYLNLLERKDFCMTHGDLNEGNIMIDGGRVSGVIDFGNMEYYVPEIDFVHPYFFDREIYDAMVENYPRDIDEKEVIFLELVVNIRHFKNIKNFDDRREKCLNNIQSLLDRYMSMQ